MTTGGARATARAVDDHPALDHVARLGLVTFGVVHLVLGWLAISLAFGDREGKADSSGAIRQLAEQPFGTVIVWAVAIGMVLLVVWQLIEALVGHRRHDGITRLRKRLTSLGKAIVYAAVATSAFRVAAGAGSSKENGTDSASARLMDLPVGQLLAGLVALGVAGVGAFLIFKGFTDRFLEDIEADGTRGHTGTVYVWLGRIGHVAKGAAVLGVAALFGYAAVSHEPKKSGGLDQALRVVLDQPFGPVLTGFFGAGFAAFGLFCFAWARHIDR
ncbi:DUF1206 domain-containing protein [Nocardioides sp. JQ2195]|uniref:DUF1206 domain-containing protein n=1 Tax=Nocardioides sp. JQ2195 TaxID=2592334 RepID=UPI00143E1C02|nr:DUF1206 domain-containing protein [Nocardioides sp. JQ2195]QIX26657.1 DUF1206 domain-containing protein [Nocardioides sp. JQ2195]